MDHPSPDLAARCVLMSSYLYYRRDSPILSDAEYDALVDVVANGWEHLEPIRKWQLESPEAIRTTGHHVRVTRLTEAAACSWHIERTGHIPPGFAIGESEWKFSKKHHVHWAYLGA